MHVTHVHNHRAFPNRPQAILIFGAGPIKRVFLKALIKFASLFTKNKIIDRIRSVIHSLHTKKSRVDTKQSGG